MPRLARHVFPGIPHHVVQRGNRREDVFFSGADRRTYLDWLALYGAACNAQVLAYCLMTNHIHAVVVPDTADGLRETFQPLHTRYAMRVHRTRDTTGRVWQGRFFSAALDEAYLYAAVRYVELNPVRAGIVGRAQDFPWSSAAAHCGLRHDPLLVARDAWLPDVGGPAAWSDWLACGDRPEQLAVLRANTRKELPCGSEAFVTELERLAGRPLRPGSRGRPLRTAPMVSEARPPSIIGGCPYFWRASGSG